MPLYEVRSEGANEWRDCADEDAAVEWARRWAATGWDGDNERTFWPRAHVYDAAGEYITTVRVRIDPREPRCTPGAAHGWRHVSTYGHGGGVVYRERCCHCDVVRETNTWDYDRSTGEQGLESICYVGSDTPEENE